MKRSFPAILIATICLAFINRDLHKAMNEDARSKGLKDYHKDYFSVGVAVSPVSPGALKNDEAPLIQREFNSVTAENAMKMGPIHPRENEYCWRDADSIVAFAKRSRLRIRGHNLCWHNQAPKWMFVDGEGKRVNRDVLLKRLKEHITAVVKRSNKSRRSYTQCISGCSASTGKRSAA